MTTALANASHSTRLHDVTRGGLPEGHRERGADAAVRRAGLKRVETWFSAPIVSCRNREHEENGPLVFPGVRLAQISPRSANDTVFVPADDEMVENFHIDQGQRGFEILGEQFVGTARFRDSRGVVVCEDDCGGIARQRVFHDFSRVDAGLT